MSILIILVIVSVIYTVLPQAKVQHANFILQNNNALQFQILELIVLSSLCGYAFMQKQYEVSFLFALVFFEHIKQMKKCYRTNARSAANIVTLFMWIAVFISLYIKRIFWALPFVSIGIINHTAELYTGFGLLQPVCLV